MNRKTPLCMMALTVACTVGFGWFLAASAAAQPAPSAPTTVYSVPITPPAPIVETPGLCPGPGYLWQSGYWVRANNTWAWIPGQWVYYPPQQIVAPSPVFVQPQTVYVQPAPVCAPVVPYCGPRVGVIIGPRLGVAFDSRGGVSFGFGFDIGGGHRYRHHR